MNELVETSNNPTGIEEMIAGSLRPQLTGVLGGRPKSEEPKETQSLTHAFQRQGEPDNINL